MKTKYQLTLSYQEIEMVNQCLENINYVNYASQMLYWKIIKSILYDLKEHFATKLVKSEREQKEMSLKMKYHEWQVLNLYLQESMDREEYQGIYPMNLIRQLIFKIDQKVR